MLASPRATRRTLPGDKGLILSLAPPLATADHSACCGCVGSGPTALLVLAMVKKHAVHSQIPPGGQVLHGAKASNLQEQLHTVDWE